MTWEMLLSSYLEELRRMWRAPSSLYLTERWLTDFVAYCRGLGLETMERVNSQHLRGYHQERLWGRTRRGGLYSANTVYQMAQMVRAWLRWARRKGHLAVDPTLGVRFSKPVASEQRVLDWGEVQAMLALPDRQTPLGLRDAVLLETLGRLGLSKLELHRLNLADVQLCTLRLSVGRPKGPRVHELSEPLAELLSAYLWDARPTLEPAAGELAVLLTRDGKRMKASSIAHQVQLYARQAGLQGAVSPRTLARSLRVLLLDQS